MSCNSKSGCRTWQRELPYGAAERSAASSETIEAKKGAKLNISPEATAGDDACGLEIRGSGLADDSFINENNIYGNNGATEEDNSTQVRSFHNNNTLTQEQNYWRFISDPELGSSWDGRCNDEISFRGFAPEPIADAGPLKDEVNEDVFQQSGSQRTQQDTDGE